jgi:N-acetylglucosamine-6-sulfatase
VKDFEDMVHAYWGTMLSVDESVGRLRVWLEETGQLDNTIIVFVGDNGLLQGEHGMVDKRRCMNRVFGYRWRFAFPR